MIRRSPLHRAVLAGLLGLATLGGPAAAAASSGADSPIRLGLFPAGERSGYVQLELEPGERAKISVDLLNAGSDLRVRTYATDAYTIVNGGFGARFEPDPRTGPAAWLEYPPATLDLRANQVTTRSASIEVPSGTPAGEYIAALVVQNDVPTAIGTGSVHQVVRSALAVVVDVPGPERPAMTVAGPEHAFVAGTSIIGFPVANTGTVRLKPTATFRLETDAGEILVDQEAGLDSFYAGLASRVEVPLAAELVAGRYCARLILRAPDMADADSGRQCFDVLLPFGSGAQDGDHVPILRARADGASTVGSPPLVGLALLIVIGFVLLLIPLRRRRRRQSGSTR